MAKIDFDQILKESVSVAKTELGNKWKKIQPFAEHEFRQLAENLVFLSELHLKGTIDAEELKGRLQFQKIATANVLLAIQGIGIIAVQNIINAVIGIVGHALQSALGFALPVV